MVKPKVKNFDSMFRVNNEIRFNGDVRIVGDNI